MIPLLKQRVLELPFRWFGFEAFTLYPFIFIAKGASPSSSILQHEAVHIRQQSRYWAWAGPLGVLFWLFLYLAVLPLGWNPWRWRWEWEAYVDGNGRPEWSVRRTLQEGYLLWWMGKS